ncbi:MAG: alpha-glucosidase [Clostridia bacterium]|nr:alpha-glucosidase [Clostridia bacterium]
MEKKTWWKEAIGYQIYPKSFKDSNHDGIGDINGITSKLDYIKSLGVNLIWLCPVYDSPMDDNGYDVRDYFKIDKTFGSIEDFDRLLTEAHKRDIKIMMDLVLNHTSDEHQWFIESENKNGKYTDYYIWQDPKFDEHGNMHPPTEWWSFFGGTTWRYSEKRKQYFMKVFSDKMPDLNWENPDVVDDMSKMILWWIKKGVDGFRIDAVAHLGKKEFVQTEDNSCNNFSNLPLVHKVLRQLNEKIFSVNNVATIGEVGGNADRQSQLSYTRESENKLNMIFTFDHVWCNNTYAAKNNIQGEKLNPHNLKYALNSNQDMIKEGGWLGLYWMNHDHPRVLSHYGNLNYAFESATALATTMYFLKGTPFIYNGEEIGMVNYHFRPDEFNDVGARNLIKTARPEDKQREYENQLLISKDHARTIMQWSGAENAGFSDHKPWFVVNPNYKRINVENQEKCENSILNHYRKILHTRKKYKDVFVYGEFQMRYIEHPYVLVYDRVTENERYTVLVNLSGNTTDFDLTNEIEKVVYQNFGEYNGKLLPYQALVYKNKNK